MTERGGFRRNEKRKEERHELDPGLRRDDGVRPTTATKKKSHLMQIDDTPTEPQPQPNEKAKLPPRNPSQIDTNTKPHTHKPKTEPPLISLHRE
jgi:hypothetical protein